jgi:hypothetical protein
VEGVGDQSRSDHYSVPLETIGTSTCQCPEDPDQEDLEEKEDRSNNSPEMAAIASALTEYQWGMEFEVNRKWRLAQD